MKVVYKLRARNAIVRVAEYIERQNTTGSGDRWVDRLAEMIDLLAKSKAEFAVCRHPSLAKFGYRCYAYNDWIIAFRITGEKFEICRFIYGPRLK
jgi:plasmid stabilization system protein ParE